jgi:hypothetical protein
MSPSVRQEWDVNSQNCVAQSPYSGNRDLVEFQRLQFCLRRTRGNLGVRLCCLLCCGKDINKGQAQSTYISKKTTSSCVRGKPGPAQEGVMFGLCCVTDKARC